MANKANVAEKKRTSPSNPSLPPDTFEEFIEPLKKKIAVLDARRTEIAQEIEAIDEQLAVAGNALKAFMGEASDGPKKASGRKRAPSKPTFSSEEVLGLIEDLVRENGELSLEDIKTSVIEKAESSGKGKVGLHKRVARILREDFKVVGDRYERV